MSFVAITTGEIATGEPVKNTTLTTIKNDLDDHESRLQSVEGGSATTYPPIIMRVNGPYARFNAQNNVLKTVTNFALTITGIRIYIENAGGAGTTTCDIKVSHSGGAYTSVLTTLPSVSYSAGNDGVSTNAVLDSTKVNLSAGDLIRLDITAVQTNGDGFMVRIDYTKT